jgi:hypothetical protein
MTIVSHPANKNYRDNYPFKDKFEEDLRREKGREERKEFGDAWKCRVCGELNDLSSYTCWYCGV